MSSYFIPVDIEKMKNGFNPETHRERCHRCDARFDWPALSCCNCKEPAQHLTTFNSDPNGQKVAVTHG